MYTETGKFTFGAASLSYTRYGSGSNTWLVFHGFGQDRQAFRSLSQFVDQELTIFCFDLFYHGESTWGYPDQPVGLEFWKEMITAFLREKAVTRFSVLGFSLGARFAQSLLRSMPQHMDRIHLLAPDGIRTDPWYALATYPWPSRRLFQWIIRNPGLFFSFLRILGYWHIIDKKLLAFVEKQMNTKEKRMQVYQAWTSFRYLRLPARHLKKLLNKHPVQLIIFFAKNDLLMNNQAILNQVKAIDKLRIQWLDCSHNRLIEAYAAGGFIRDKKTLN